MKGVAGHIVVGLLGARRRIVLTVMERILHAREMNTMMTIALIMKMMRKEIANQNALSFDPIKSIKSFNKSAYL